MAKVSLYQDYSADDNLLVFGAWLATRSSKVNKCLDLPLNPPACEMQSFVPSKGDVQHFNQGGPFYLRMSKREWTKEGGGFCFFPRNNRPKGTSRGFWVLRICESEGPRSGPFSPEHEALAEVRPGLGGRKQILT